MEVRRLRSPPSGPTYAALRQLHKSKGGRAKAVETLLDAMGVEHEWEAGAGQAEARRLFMRRRVGIPKPCQCARAGEGGHKRCRKCGMWRLLMKDATKYKGRQMRQCSVCSTGSTAAGPLVPCVRCCAVTHETCRREQSPYVSEMGLCNKCLPAHTLSEGGRRTEASSCSCTW